MNQYSHIFTPNEIYNEYIEREDNDAKIIYEKLLEKYDESKLLSMHISLGDIAKICEIQHVWWCAAWILPRTERKLILRILVKSLKRTLKYITNAEIHSYVSLLDVHANYLNKYTKEHRRVLFDIMPQYEIGCSLKTSGVIAKIDDPSDVDEGVKKVIHLLGEALKYGFSGWRFQAAMLFTGPLCLRTLVKYPMWLNNPKTSVQKELEYQVIDICDIFEPLVFKT